EAFVGTKGNCRPDQYVINGQRILSREQDKAAVDPYIQEHTDLIASIRSGKPINELRNVAESSLTAIMGRMAGYTGKTVTWQKPSPRNDPGRPDYLGLHDRGHRFPSAFAAGVRSLALQLDRLGLDFRRQLPVLLAGDWRRLPSPVDSSRVSLSEVVRAHAGRARRLLFAGFTGSTGSDSSAAPPALRRTARSAQPDGPLVLGPRRLAV